MLTTNGSRARAKIVLVAGGAGFLGSHLCERLVGEGHRVVCVDNLQTGALSNLSAMEREPRFEFVPADIGMPIRRSLPADEIYNLACPASPPHYQADPVHTMMTSVLGTHQLLELARRNGATYVQASTSEVYGDPHRHPQREDYWGNVNPTGPRACYDEGKRAGEALCFDYLRAGWADVRIARIFNTYGPRMRPDDGRIVSNFATQALRDEPLTIYGKGRQTRSFCFVTDLVTGLLALMDCRTNPRAPVNLGNPGEYSVLQIARKILALTGSRSPITFKPLPVDDPKRRRPDISRAEALLGWRPQVSLDEGLVPTVAWFGECVGVQRARSTSPQPVNGASETGGYLQALA